MEVKIARHPYATSAHLALCYQGSVVPSVALELQTVPKRHQEPSHDSELAGGKDRPGI